MEPHKAEALVADFKTLPRIKQTRVEWSWPDGGTVSEVLRRGLRAILAIFKER